MSGSGTLDDLFGKPVYPTKSKSTQRPNDNDEVEVCGWGHGSIQQQVESSMNRQLESTKKSIGLIDQSEKTGVETAEELLRQGEQLDNVEQNLDQINHDMKVTQKHLDSIKSVFGGLKNWFTGNTVKSVEEEKKKSDLAAAKQREHRMASNKLNTSLNDNKQQQQSSTSYMHPVDRMRQNDDDLVKQAINPPNVYSKYEKQLDDNLDLMAGGMARLKNLSLGLQNEIETQNKQLETISDKADRADTKLRDQNRQMGKILK